jgi:hypothetical protein
MVPAGGWLLCRVRFCFYICTHISCEIISQKKCFCPLPLQKRHPAPQVRVVGGPGEVVSFFIAVHAISYEIISQMK